MSILFGTAYYPEYQSAADVDDDLERITAARFNVIRVGESVWSTWEPRDGEFDLDWLEPVLDGAHRRGISVIIGTPTYAVPPWLVRLYPDIAGERHSGEQIPWGSRQEVDFTHPAFRLYAERVVRQILGRYARHPAVIGFQVDNEPGNELLHNHGVFQRFVDHLRQTYGTCAELNREWGLTYWSHRLSAWDELWRPDGNAQPQYDVAWRAFQAQQTTELIAWQAAVVREYSRPDQFVTTCIAYERPAVDDHRLGASLDVSGANLYYGMQDSLRLPDERSPGQGWTTDSVWALYQSADRAYATRQDGFLVNETNAMSIGKPWENRPGYDGQWRQAAWAFVSRGAQMVSYWHWNTLPFGAETHWGGVLPHSGRPGRTHAELRAVGEEFQIAGDTLEGLVPDADIGVVYSTASRWLMQKHGQLSLDDGSPDARSYRGLLDPFVQGAFSCGLQMRIYHSDQLVHAPGGPRDLADRTGTMVAAGMYLASDDELDWLLEYAQCGGHLVIGPRTGCADPLGRVRDTRQPGRLADAAGTWYDEYSNVSGRISMIAAEDGLLLPPQASATRWIEGLHAETSTVLARYDHPHFGQFAAITTSPCGEGRVTCVGTVPDAHASRALFEWATVAELPSWRPTSPTMTCTSAVSAEGRRLRFVHNWSWEASTFTVPSAATDVLTGVSHGGGDALELAPWDVVVLAEK